MKKIIAILIAVAVLLAPLTVFGATSNKQLAENYCHKHYSKKTVKFVKENSSLTQNRKGKKNVVVEKITSTSHGKYGYTKDGYYIAYNKKHKKGTKVVSYAIWNPYTNYIDDVVAVVDSGKVR